MGLKPVAAVWTAAPMAALSEPSTKVDLRGAPDAKFNLMKTMRARGLERSSVHCDYLKFTDDAVSYLRFVWSFRAERE